MFKKFNEKKEALKKDKKLAAAYEVHKDDWEKSHGETTSVLEDGTVVTSKECYEGHENPEELAAYKRVQKINKGRTIAGVVAAIGGVAFVAGKVIETIARHKAEEEPEATAIDDEYPIEIDENGNELISHEELNNLGFELKEEEKTE